MTKFISQSAAQTKKQGEVLAKHILKKPAGQRAVVLALEGGLGSGKTTFLQGFANGLGIKENITSPTFVIIKNYQLPQRHSARGRPTTPIPFGTGQANYQLPQRHSARGRPTTPIPFGTGQANYQLPTTNYQLFYHLDCWRLEKPQDVLWLGFKEIISNPKNIVAVEWAGKIKAVLPEDVWRLQFSFDGKNSRRIVFWLKKR